MPSRPVLALVVVGLLLLPGPAYAGVVDSLDRDRMPTGYGAEAVDLDDTETRERLAAEFDHEVTVYPFHVADAPSNRYQAPNRTAEVLRRAYTGRTVRITDDAVRADVTLLAQRAEFVARDADNGPRRLVLDRSGEGIVVSTREASPTAVFEAVRNDIVVHYDALPPAERATTRKVLNASVGEGRGYYRPYRDEPHPEFPAVVEKDGEHYLVRPTIHVDDFGPDGLFAGLAASGVGLVCLLGAVATAFVERSGSG